jgi:hypothetical protein
MGNRETTGHYVNGKWVPHSISPVKGSGDTSATTRAGLRASGLGAAASAQKAKPRVPQRKDYAGDKEYQTAFQAYMKQQNGDTDTVAQKRALGRMK